MREAQQQGHIGFADLAMYVPVHAYRKQVKVLMLLLPVVMMMKLMMTTTTTMMMMMMMMIMMMTMMAIQLLLLLLAEGSRLPVVNKRERDL